MSGFRSEAALIDEVQQRLVRKYPHLTTDQITSAVQKAYAVFAESRVRDFIPLLVERRASAELSQQTPLLAAT